ncbi:MAG: hypothetical protein A2Z88_06965 [Omnitrophica WOR_2 bacterium GWA2_47_8]|nr:MAG: hypothetical protein A2Z88_06965 [Omnitrophica WOR_2 bacterium GWA2_47_8]
MKNPLVSICIPAYNRPELIKRSLDSCLRQTYTNIEVVVVDDASTDSTPDVIKAYVARDPRIKYYRNEKNLGMVPNWGRTFELATGEYIQHLGSDDRLTDDFIEEKMRVFEKYPDVAFVGAGIRTYLAKPDGTFSILNETKYPTGRYEASYLFGNFYRKPAIVCTACTVRRRDILKHFMDTIPNTWGYDNAYRRGGKIMDVVIFLNILADYRFMYYLDNVFYESTEHQGNSVKMFFGLTRGVIGDHIKFNHMDQMGFSYFYTNYAPQYLSRYRIFMGSNTLAGTFFDLLLKRASGSPWRALRDFFGDYSFKERFFSFVIFPLCVFQRVGEWILRK